MQKLGCVGLFSAIVVLAVSAPRHSIAQENQQNNSHYKVLHSFQGTPAANGNFDPLLVLGMTADEEGTIYGVSQQGGALVCITVGGVCVAQVFQGTQFKLGRDGQLTLFPNNQTVPPFPVAASQGPLLLDGSGQVLFTTPAGGVFNGTGGVFSLDPQTGAVAALGDLSANLSMAMIRP